MGFPMGIHGDENIAALCLIYVWLVVWNMAF